MNIFSYFFDVVPPNIFSLDDKIIGFFNQYAWWGNLLLAFISIFLACVFSGLIGYERESHGHFAGFRTHILVAAGSSLIMYLSIYGFSFESFPNHDPARLAAQVVTGIGFLGAGTILKTGVDIKGLTTATTLWVCMAIGLATGAGRFTVALFTTLIVLIVLKFLRHAEAKAFEKTPRLVMICDYNAFAIKIIKELADKFHIAIKNINTQICNYHGKDAVSISISLIDVKRETVDQFGEELRIALKPFEIKY